MDIFATIFYAVVCAVLGIAAPRVSSFWMRIGMGALVGVVASNLLPVIKSLIGVG
ncbi:hypothetical protein [uncultured Cohaesibacter sp.]|uniref:hypothetical protein n=1 Tax=uncultured Cohaesibacter sp. TaxID=1002546 RepID=UPI0029C844AE|nr:hypothetical protein [uncultured Cohaesibacter sp.]